MGSSPRSATIHRVRHRACGGSAQGRSLDCSGKTGSHWFNRRHGLDSTRAGTADPVCPACLGTSVRPIYRPALRRYVQLGVVAMGVVAAHIQCDNLGGANNVFEMAASTVDGVLFLDYVCSCFCSISAKQAGRTESGYCEPLYAVAVAVQRSA